MAKLITTEAEKAAASYLDWSDEALGKMCKKMALLLQSRRTEEIAKGKKNDDIAAVIQAADGILIVGQAIECNAGTLTMTFGDFTHNKRPSGDWEIRVRRVPKKKAL